MKKWRIDRIISIATLVTSVVALLLVLKKPAPVAVPQTPAQIAANAQSFQQKIGQLEQAPSPSQQPQSVDSIPTTDPEVDSADGNTQASAQTASMQLGSTPSGSGQPAETHITSDEVNAALTQAMGAATSDGAGLSPGADVGSMPAIKDQKVSFDGDLVHGQFLTTIAGKDVWVTVSGHIGSKDGYATFDPTEFKVGDLNIPVSLVNGPLQKKLAEQRDRLKLPNSVGGVKVDNGELVLQQK